MTAKNYAQAGYEALQGGMDADVVLARLKEVLKKNGHDALYKESVVGLLTRFEKDDADSVAQLTIAKAGDEKKFEGEIKEFLKAQGIEKIETTVDETLTGGFIISGKGKELNASYKRSLLDIYKSLVN